mmetsp:Transcript_12318/g.33745  ORF Transcript_12318/g.33745 Transcript_12318/m.33745 type:complete len:231 (+) Transcript_12318:188-880(+)
MGLRCPEVAVRVQQPQALGEALRAELSRKVEAPGVVVELGAAQVGVVGEDPGLQHGVCREVNPLRVETACLPSRQHPANPKGQHLHHGQRQAERPKGWPEHRRGQEGEAGHASKGRVPVVVLEEGQQAEHMADGLRPPPHGLKRYEASDGMADDAQLAATVTMHVVDVPHHVLDLVLQGIDLPRCDSGFQRVAAKAKDHDLGTHGVREALGEAPVVPRHARVAREHHDRA